MPSSISSRNTPFFFGIPLIFIGIVIWVFRPGSKKRYQEDANLPFYGDKKK
jgi:cbb3-type cytochrome oxidase subunit 3